MRARNIKPGFFKNEILGELSPIDRLVFIGLWCMADREGRLENRPKRIKAEIVPWDDCDMEKIISSLEKGGFLVKYTVDDAEYIQIVNFKKHQNPHYKETDSVIPPPDCDLLPKTQDVKKRSAAKNNSKAKRPGAKTGTKSSVKTGAKTKKAASKTAASQNDEKPQCEAKNGENSCAENSKKFYHPQGKPRENPADILITDTLIADIRIPDDKVRDKPMHGGAHNCLYNPTTAQTTFSKRTRAPNFSGYFPQRNYNIAEIEKKLIFSGMEHDNDKST